MKDVSRGCGLLVTLSFFTIILLLSVSAASYNGKEVKERERKEMNVINESVLETQFETGPHAPEFDASTEWVNLEEPLTLKELKGKLVLLDFWTYCCINCMHVLPDLKKLEQKYRNELIVIGIHSAKFQNEKENRHIHDAIERYGIEHPVINDADFELWNRYGVRAWPTLMLIGPHGRMIDLHSGEGVYDAFDPTIRRAIDYFGSKGLLKHSPIHIPWKRKVAAPSLLSYPGKITFLPKKRRLVVSDSGHHRILVLKLDGEIEEIIGSGTGGLLDGSFEESQFQAPQGVCADPEEKRLYIADTENHAIRQIDLESRQVKTIAGRGEQGRVFGQQGKGILLNSPWDLTLKGDLLYVAMAGFHQIYSINLNTLEAKIVAGTGRENLLDGLRLRAALAQPSGIAMDADGKTIFFVDSEASAVRKLDLSENGSIETLIGEGLFEFGDQDGAFSSAKLQHPLGVAWHNGELYVADTYNHKIKKLDLKNRTIQTWIGTGKAGLKDGAFTEAMLYEPSGLVFLEDSVYIVDCNNHLLRIGDLKRQTISTLTLNVKK